MPETHHIGSNLEAQVPPTTSASSSSHLGPTTVDDCLPEWAQNEFQADICRFFLVANIDWRAIDILFVGHFFSKYVPGTNLPTWKELSVYILDQEADRVVHKHLTPLEIATTLVQDDATQLDTIFLTIAYLYRFFHPGIPYHCESNSNSDISGLDIDFC